MASQQPPVRPWFRLAARPAPAAAPAPSPTPSFQPAPPQPRPAFVRPTFVQTFRPPVAQSQPNQPQEPAAPPPFGTASVPSSPITKASAPSSSLTSSPAPASTILVLSGASSSSVPPSPKPIVSAPSSSLPTSPSALSAASSSSVPPPSPKIKVISLPSSSLPTYAAPSARALVEPSYPAPVAPPPSPVRAAPTSVLMTARAAYPTISPPKVKPSTPLSPLILPPAQIKSDVQPEPPKIPAEAEQKTVLLQETIEKPVVMPKTSSNGEFQRYGGREVKKPDSQTSKDKGGKYKKWSSSESEEGGMRIITLAGENKGAIMELSPSQKKSHVIGGNPPPHNVLYKKGNIALGDDEKSEGGLSKMINNEHKTSPRTPPPPPMTTAFMNSNVQGVNNSILFNSSSTHHDPGVHLSLSRKLNGGHGMHLKD
ncbi:vegetative cell wall protein gp1-like [Cornus florida]|uniref:vegetative cell wall protein gp1-like n=1 Tax=Cornus florida TaxID=4283 RepID=UPI00289B5933|nr:vegetative cell wall protein gp1-like [Cornus florida]